MQSSPFPLTTHASLQGVTLRVRGEGRPVFIFPGMEGSGESCLHLALPVLDAQPDLQAVLVDYGAEEHETFEDLVETLHTLVGEEAGKGPSLFWAQSFGNLLAAAIAARGDLDIERFTMVSPFMELPPWKVHAGVLSLAVTPGFLYRATVRPMSRYLFGPAGDQSDHLFFDALHGAPVSNVLRRTRWLRGRRFPHLYEKVNAPARVWLGMRDRLVNLSSQQAFFAELTDGKSNYSMRMVPGSGHVVLPTEAVEMARRDLSAWIAS